MFTVSHSYSDDYLSVTVYDNTSGRHAEGGSDGERTHTEDTAYDPVGSLVGVLTGGFADRWGRVTQNGRTTETGGRDDWSDDREVEGPGSLEHTEQTNEDGETERRNQLNLPVAADQLLGGILYNLLAYTTAESEHRQRFFDALKDAKVPKSIIELFSDGTTYEVHHLKQQVLREVYELLEVDINDPKYLVTLPTKLHKRVNKYQGRLLKELRDKFGAGNNAELVLKLKHLTRNELKAIVYELDGHAK